MIRFSLLCAAVCALYVWQPGSWIAAPLALAFPLSVVLFPARGKVS